MILERNAENSFEKDMDGKTKFSVKDASEILLEDELNRASQCGEALRQSADLRHHKRHDDENQGWEKDSRVSCEYCGKSFSSTGTLTRHMIMHTDEKPYVCEQCGKAFWQKSTLENHRRIHSGERPFVCSECGKGYVQRSGLSKHVRRVHGGYKEHTFHTSTPCEYCGKSFCSMSTLKRHKQIHTGEKPFSCEQCGKQFHREHTLKEHQAIHAGRKSHSCFCGKSFYFKTYLRTHQKCVHEGVKPLQLQDLQCGICSKSFGTKTHLARHKLIHTGEKPFVCEQCGKAFAQKSHLKRHQKIHFQNKEPFSCEECGEPCHSVADLRSHMTKVHQRQLPSEYPLECDYCLKIFKQCCSLSRHLQSHTGEVAHSCEQCGAQLSNSRLNFSGNNENIYSHDNCGMPFRRLATLTGHNCLQTDDAFSLEQSVDEVTCSASPEKPSHGEEQGEANASDHVQIPINEPRQEEGEGRGDKARADVHLEADVMPKGFVEKVIDVIVKDKESCKEQPNSLSLRIQNDQESDYSLNIPVEQGVLSLCHGGNGRESLVSKEPGQAAGYSSDRADQTLHSEEENDDQGSVISEPLPATTETADVACFSQKQAREYLHEKAANFTYITIKKEDPWSVETEDVCRRRWNSVDDMIPERDISETDPDSSKRKYSDSAISVRDTSNLDIFSFKEETEDETVAEI